MHSFLTPCRVRSALGVYVVGTDVGAFERYAAAFLGHNVDGQALVNLTCLRLKNTLRVTDMDHRRKIFDWIEHLMVASGSELETEECAPASPHRAAVVEQAASVRVQAQQLQVRESHLRSGSARPDAPVAHVSWTHAAGAAPLRAWATHAAPAQPAGVGGGAGGDGGGGVRLHAACGRAAEPGGANVPHRLSRTPVLLHCPAMAVPRARVSKPSR